MSSRDEINTLIRRARDFLATARYQFNNGIYDLAVFNLEQSLQLFLKARILEHGVQYPRTNSIRYLLKFLHDIAHDYEKPIISGILSKYLFELGVLEDAYINARYVPREYTREEAEALIKVVEEVMNSV
ncbi:HEPN domain-containing protein [Caldivirga maquilingensis]|uniref:HEPN domain protein n=1 Tax=Caldivirga maquilingensis (strain ATCC 700844 / DSM 13496 / JCM 10307 / IC-167) TaxID=397948 RepID=A8M9G9_CALMQ|nr:HEPN domain-containing protein [Caldivirga maquilingensis]ABW02388.1 HEPN domain protein [Caldivirga maquilingensis IC-167]